MSATLSLVRSNRVPTSAETISELEELLAEAKRGDLSGIAYVALRPGTHFTINATGSAAKVPAYSLGALHALQAFLFSLMH